METKSKESVLDSFSVNANWVYVAKKIIFVATVTLLFTQFSVTANANELANGDFETNPPPNFGNNIGYPILPWVLGIGNSSNVVKVDGPGGLSYANNGPESDASAPGSGIPQHYLDIANGENDFYQTFTPECSGEVVFGGYFSTRADKNGTATVAIREGVGTNGPVVGATNPVLLPGGNSRSDPWTPMQNTLTLNAGSTYSVVVSMDNNMNFDNGFVEFKTGDCAPDNGCTLTQGYWKNHNRYEKSPKKQIPWPIDEDTNLCGKSYIDILTTQPRGDAWLILAHQWIAAQLNTASGASSTPAVADAIDLGGHLLATCATGQADHQALVEYSETLDEFNNGLIGPGHCD